MIQAFVNEFMSRQGEMRAQFAQAHPQDYVDIVRMVIDVIKGAPPAYTRPSSDRITEITTDGYQGVLLFVIAGEAYSYDFWVVKVNYGSCSGCDALEGIRNYNDGLPSEEQINDYMTLALHIVQGMRQVD